MASLIRCSVCILLAVLLFCSSIQSADLPKPDSKVIQQLKSYLQSHYMTPEDYVISKFQDHDVVFLGEHHRFKQNVELVQDLIPKLYANGIFTLATEFARHEDQPLVDRLLNAPVYEETLARQITFNEFVVWGYQEYVDVFKAAWRLNHQLPSGNRRFRILGVNCSPDWSVLQTEADEKNAELEAKVWRDCNEEQWAKVILDEVVAKGEKALVYSGIHHAFTEYRQPVEPAVKDGKLSFAGFGLVRMGNYVYNAIGKRAITISLHRPWPSSDGYDKGDTYAADGYIDALLADVQPKFRRAGFDTSGTPFGDLPGDKSVYKYGYEKFTLSRFCDGYIVQGPLRGIEGVTPIKDFINRENLAVARAQMPNPKFRHASVEEFNRAIAEDASAQIEGLAAVH